MDIHASRNDEITHIHTATDSLFPTSIAQRPRITFSNLPAELRTAIYDLAFAVPAEPVDLTDARRWAPNKGLLLSCRQAYLEARVLHAQAIPVFWNTAQFVISDLGLPNLMQRLKRQRPHNLNRLHRLTIKVPFHGSSLTVTAKYLATQSQQGPGRWQIIVSDHLPVLLGEARKNLIVALAMSADEVRRAMATQRSVYRVAGIAVKHADVRMHEILAMVWACRRFWVEGGGRKWREPANRQERQKMRRLQGATRESHALMSKALSSGHVKFDG